MPSSETILLATINRLSERLSDAKKYFKHIAKDAPKKIKKEWELFQEEVLSEADRIEENSNHEADTVQTTKKDELQDKITSIREILSKLSSQI